MPEPRSDRSRTAARRDAPEAAAEDGRLDLLDLVELWPTLARMGVLASLRAAGWATSRSVAAGRRVAAAARAGESPGQLYAAAREQALASARQALGVTDIEATLGRVTSDEPEGPGSDRRQRKALRERGEELLARSASVEPEEAGHPAFGVVLEELAPDEVRILRVLATKGDQPTLDVDATGPLGVGGKPVAERLTMIGKMAGCRHPALLQLYLDNLVRLGLVVVTDDPLSDEEAYQVLEAQPEVQKATEDASRARLVRRRLALSHFGRCFCEICLPLEEKQTKRSPRRRSSARRTTKRR